jgi:hypothetical protein
MVPLNGSLANGYTPKTKKPKKTALSLPATPFFGSQTPGSNFQRKLAMARRTA